MRFLLVLFVLALVAGCDTAEDDGLLLRVDFEEGTTLRYEHTSATGPTADSLTVVSRDTFEARVADTDATLEGISGLVALELSDGTDEARVWYRQRRDALEEVAYESSLVLGVAPTLRTAGAPASLIATASGRTASVGTGEVIFREPERIVVRYPAEQGDEWAHWRTDEVGLHSTREVVGYEDVTTPAGTFRCVVLRSRIYQGGEDTGTEMLDYVGERGLVRRVVRFTGQATDEHGNPIGLQVSEERQELIAVEG